MAICSKKAILLFMNSFDLCQRTWWVREFLKNIDTGIIIATNAKVNSLFDNLFTIVSKREGFHVSRNCITMSFLDEDTDSLLSCNCNNKFLYVDNYESMYSSKNSKKWEELDKVERIKSGNITIIANEWLRDKIEVADYYTRNMDFKRMESILWQR
jgi:hypothetical protein